MTLAQIQVRRGSANDWLTANPTLAAGEIGFDTTTGQIRVGNGLNTWTSLTPFYPGVTAGGGGGGGTGGGGGSLLIASAVSPQIIKDRADVVCIGTGDAAAINNAIRNANNRWLGGFTTGNRYGSIELADGVYQLESPILIPNKGFSIFGQGWGTVLMKAANGDWSGGEGSTPALIKIDDTTSGEHAQGIHIRDICIWGRNRSSYGAAVGTGSPVAGIWLELTKDPGEMNEPNGWGIPASTATGDSFAKLHNILVRDTTTGIYWSNTGSGREVQMNGCISVGVQVGGSAFHINGSDTKIVHCVAAAGGSGAKYGYNINGGNSMISFCKAFYFQGAGSAGFYGASSRTLMGTCESQDNDYGFVMVGDNLTMDGCHADNQVAGMNRAVDLAGCNHFCVSGLNIQNRGSGTFAWGLVLPTSKPGKIDAYIDSTGITSELGEAASALGTPTAITTSSQIGSAINAEVIVDGTTAYRRAIAAA